ncbi:hypothetical protein [Gellertiella hungarica]|uniref:Uncharacterized protein n=1 Tax=Gellertiella hungarica TaxID=1572859 RepID=A0A7W6NLJ6_9HYPH|nr:hypothetical protein [Gellertiella hungarica]MBB4065649.1 hypothetical protein [Gellertiella hungarica]
MKRIFYFPGIGQTKDGAGRLPAAMPPNKDVTNRLSRREVSFPKWVKSAMAVCKREF